jgi:hypothetical protein
VVNGSSGAGTPCPSGTSSRSLTKLTPGTTYTVSAKATNKWGSASGPSIQFRTTDVAAPPSSPPSSSPSSSPSSPPRSSPTPSPPTSPPQPKSPAASPRPAITPSSTVSKGGATPK